jgi:replicative DNA helicase
MKINDQVIQQVKDHLKDYLKERGIDTRKPFKCINPSHNDNKPSMDYFEKANIIRCFGCNKSYDIISLYAQDNNLDTTKDFKKIIEDLAIKYNISASDTTEQITQPIQSYYKKPNKEDFTKYLNQVKKNIDKTDYLQKRGISDAIINKYNIGYDITKKMVILPISKTCYVGRSTELTPLIKHFKPKGVSNELFNGDYLKNSTFKTIVWVTEAIIDALSLEDANNDIKAIALNSANNFKQLEDIAQSNDFKGVIVLALDTDHEGLTTSKTLKEDLDALGIQAVIFNSDTTKYNTKTTDGQDKLNKDINEFLLADKEELTRVITNYNDMLFNGLETKAKKLYEQENLLNYLDDFNKQIKDREFNKPISTGIDDLDKALDGGFYKKNLIILGAISSLGKTTLALQIGDNVAKQGQDVLIFSIEMSKDELMAKSLSRLSYENTRAINSTYLALTTRDILTGKCLSDSLPNSDKSKDTYKDAIDSYKPLAQHEYITECNDTTDITISSISDKVKQHIAITGNKPLVIIDYLQIIQNNEKGLTDKQAVDKVVVSLKRLARENDIAILLISAFNRNSYNQASSQASFRDSSAIEYTSDVLMALQITKIVDYDEDKDKAKISKAINTEQQQDNRELTLKILKNRNGRITDINGITFYAKYNYMYFKEDDFIE